MSRYEEQLVTRAEMLDDTGELVQAVTAVLAGARGAGVDPAAIASLAAAARALDPGAHTGYHAGSKQDRHPGGGYGSDGEFLKAVSDAEGEVRERLQEAGQLREQATATLDAAQAALEDARQALTAAHARATRNPCDGCHPTKATAIAVAEAAIAAAEQRIRICEAALDLLDPLVQRLQRALELLQQVSQDLGEVYELVYTYIRNGGKLPMLARWIEGAGAGQ